MIRGPCTIVDECILSPNYPGNYSDNETLSCFRCSTDLHVELTLQTVIMIIVTVPASPPVVMPRM